VARVIVAMSGGVDSSVAAALLVGEGHEVTGVTMRLLPEESPGGCCPSGSVRDARAVCDVLGIPHYTWDAREVFALSVVEAFVDGYAAGRTPNPCIDCNDRVKFAFLLPKALSAGAECLATGHYARIVETGGAPRLAMGADRSKDQSYFLYRTTGAQLRHVLFPVGDLTKAEVRRTAQELGLPTAARPESQEACFVPAGNVRAFVRERRPASFERGPIVDASGAIVGGHDGAVGFTIGQRRGLGGGGRERRYVTSVRPADAVVVVGGRTDVT
jgi:tRNA-specific 2-thiouridylase